MPEAPTAPAPSAPAVEPKIPSTVPVINLSGQSSSTPATPQPEERSMFDKIDDAAGVKRKPAPKAEEKPKAKEEVKDAVKELADDKPEKPEEKATDKPAEQKTEEATKAKEPKPSAWQLYRDLEKKHKALEAENAQLKTSSPKPTDHPEFKKVSEERDNLAKRLAELEDEVKYVNYEASSEYKEQYEKPYTEAMTDAVNDIAQFRVTDSEGNVRQANENDFYKIVNARDTEEALAIAEELFGSPSKAALAVQMRQRVREAYTRAERAKKEFRTKGNEREKQTQEQRAREVQQKRESFEKANKEAEEKFPQYFKPKDGDEKANELLRKGFQTVDAAFNGKSTPQIDSEIRMKAGAFNRLAYEWSNTKKELEAALAKIAEYENSEPTPGDPEAVKGGEPKERSFEELVDMAAAKNRR